MRAIVTTLLVLCTANGVSAAEWSFLGPQPITNGPYSGRLSSVAASRTTSGLYYAGAASGGVWRTDDGGTTWIPLTDALPGTIIGALALDPNNDDILYAGSGEANFANHSLYGRGLYKTVDGGATWTHLAEDTFGGRTFSRLVIAHDNSQTLYAAITHAGGFPERVAGKNHPGVDGPVGVFKSIDGGSTWTLLRGGLPAAPASDIVIHPTNSSLLYAAIGRIFGGPDNGIYRSTTGGTSWTQLTTGLPVTPGRISLAIAPSLPDRMYTLITEPATSSGGSAETDDIYRSNDGGATWSPTNAGNLQATYGWYLSAITVGPTDPDLVFAGGLNLLRSTDGGGVYSNVTPPHVDIHGLTFDVDGQLLCANDGGLHISNNSGSSWVARNDTLGVVQFYAGLSTHPTDPSFIIGGTQDNGTNRRTTAQSGWSSVLGGDGGYTALDHDMPNIVFAEWQGTGNLRRSTSSGTGWSWAGTGIVQTDRNCFLPPYAFIPGSSTRMLYATHRIYESVDSGQSWSPISEDVTGGGSAAIRALAIAPSNALTVYVATNDGRVLVSRDGGATFELVRSGGTLWPRVTRELAVHPTQDGLAYLAVSEFGTDQILRASNYGATWVAIDGDLPDVPANCVAAWRRGHGTVVFLGTDTGVYLSCDDGDHWRRYGDGMPNVPIIDIVVDHAHNRVIAATLGRGAWSIPLPPQQPSIDIHGYRSFQSCFTGSAGTPQHRVPSPGCAALYDNDLDNDIDVTDFLCIFPIINGP